MKVLISLQVLNDVQEEGKYVWASGEESEFDNNEDLFIVKTG